MQQLEFLLEERSMEEVLKVLLPKILPAQWQLYQNVFLRVHEGKSDLQRSIPRKIRTYAHMPHPVAVIVLHDQDAGDCRELKNHLLDLCQQPGVNVPYLIRIVCRELEAWYLGDMEAIERAYPHFRANRYKNKAKFRNPDSCNAKDELRKILPELQQIGSAQAIAPHLNTSANSSDSFKQFVQGLSSFLQQFEDAA